MTFDKHANEGELSVDDNMGGDGQDSVRASEVETEDEDSNNIVIWISKVLG